MNGKILLRLPKSLHADLAYEAKREGISMNQLILFRLSLTVGSTVRVIRQPRVDHSATAKDEVSSD